MLKYQALQRKNYGNVNLAAICFFLFLGTGCFSQERQLDIGLRFQKTINLYYENGITFQYTDDRLLSQRLFLGLSYATSRLGSAMGTNAIKQNNFILSSAYIFRPQRNLQPFLRLNTGYFIADYEEPIFDVLPNTSFLLSPEAGLGYKFKNPLKANASLGYNLITGDGIDGAGTLYPLFIQTSITWNVLAKKKDHETAF